MQIFAAAGRGMQEIGVATYETVAKAPRTTKAA
jgi:hypothetical protein